MRRPRGPIALHIADNPELKDRIRFILKTKGIEAVEIGETVGETPFNLVITDRKEAKFKGEVKTLFVHEKLNEDELLESISLLSKLPRRCDEVVIGIDPGLTIGAAALCRNSLIDVSVAGDIAQLINWIEKVDRIVKPSSTRIRIGRGEKWRETFDAIGKLRIKAMSIELVDEARTTKPPLQGKRAKYGKDVEAAIKIALKL